VEELGQEDQAHPDLDHPLVQEIDQEGQGQVKEAAILPVIPQGQVEVPTEEMEAFKTTYH